MKFKTQLVGAIFASLIASTANAHLVKFNSTEDVIGTNMKIGNTVSKQSLGSYNVDVYNNGSMKSFVGFCVDPFQDASTSWSNYKVTSLDANDFIDGSATRLTNVQKLFDNAYDTLNGDAYKTAGFHLALWEIFNDDMDLNAGHVRTVDTIRRWWKYKPGTDSKVEGYASTFLASLNGWDVQDKYYFNFYENSHLQDYLEVIKNPPAAVPVPAALPLFASALAGFGVVRRRNKAKAL